MHDLLQIGSFPPELQAVIDSEFQRHDAAALEREPELRNRLRAVLTRSNVGFGPELLASLPKVEVIATFGVGYDRLPLQAAAARGIRVSHTPDVLNTAVAELCIGLLLALSRRLPAADRFVRSGAWPRAVFPLGTGLAGKQVGIVGLGRIGKEVALRLAPFGVRIAYHGRSDQRLEWDYEPSLPALARRSDILILAAPGGAATRAMVDAAVLRELGPAGMLVNVGRGSLVDQDALLAALATGTIAGAALDVFDNEPDIDPRFLALENVVLAPHIGSATTETRTAMLRLALDNLHCYFERAEVLTPVPLD